MRTVQELLGSPGCANDDDLYARIAPWGSWGAGSAVGVGVGVGVRALTAQER